MRPFIIALLFLTLMAAPCQAKIGATPAQQNAEMGKPTLDKTLDGVRYQSRMIPNGVLHTKYAKGKAVLEVLIPPMPLSDEGASVLSDSLTPDDRGRRLDARVYGPEAERFSSVSDEPVDTGTARFFLFEHAVVVWIQGHDGVEQIAVERRR